MPSPEAPGTPGTFTQILRGDDLEAGPPRVEPPVVGPPLSDASGAPAPPPPQVASPDQGGVNPLSPSATPSLPDTYNLEGTPKDSLPRAPEVAPASSSVKPLEDPSAPAEPGNMFNPAPDYLDRLRTPTSPQPSVVPPPAGPPPLKPGTASASAYTMVIKGATLPTAPGPVAPAPQPPPPSPATAQPQPARWSSRVLLIIGIVVIVAIVIALLVFVVLGGGGGAAGTAAPIES